MLWVRQTSAHSPRTLAKPRKRKWRNPRASLIWPKTDSQIEKRIHQSLLHEIVFALIRSVERRQIAIVCGSGIATHCLPGFPMFCGSNSRDLPEPIRQGDDPAEGGDQGRRRGLADRPIPTAFEADHGASNTRIFRGGLHSASIKASARSGERTPRSRARSLDSILIRPWGSSSHRIPASCPMVSSSVSPST